MKRALAVLAGIAVGVFLAGTVAPLVILVLPPELRSVRVVWATTAVVVALTAAVTWVIWAPRRE